MKILHTADWHLGHRLHEQSQLEEQMLFLGWIENYIIDSEKNPSKRETFQFYKRIMYQKGETPLGIGKFSKAFSEYFEDSKSDGIRTWLNIDFKEPKQESLEEFDNNE